MKTNTKICLISSHGGHLYELQKTADNVMGEKYWVTFGTDHTKQLLLNHNHYFIVDPHLSKLKYLINLFQSLKHLMAEKPSVVISTGAGIAIPTVLLAKFFFKAKIIFIESAANVITPSRTGKLLYKYSDIFLVQWKQMLKEYPKAVYTGLL